MNNSFALWFGFWCIAQFALLWFYVWVAMTGRLRLSPQRQLRSYHQGLLWVFTVPILGWWLQTDQWFPNEEVWTPRSSLFLSTIFPQGLHSLPSIPLKHQTMISFPNTAWISITLFAWILGMALVFTYYYAKSRQLSHWTNNTILWRKIGSLEIRVADLIVPMSYVLKKRKIIVLDHKTLARPIDRNLIISHEIQHIRQGDHNVVRLNLLFRGLFWHHPILYLLLRKLSELEELACDATIVKRFTAKSSRYCQILLEITQRAACVSSSPQTVSKGLSHGILSTNSKCSLLRKRIENIDQELKRFNTMNIDRNKPQQLRSLFRSHSNTRQRMIWISTVFIASLAGSASVAFARSRMVPEHSFHHTHDGSFHSLPTHPLIDKKLSSIIENPQLRQSYRTALIKLDANRPQLTTILAKSGVPEYLLAIPVVESRFSPSAGSNRLNRNRIPRSLGVWQMIPSTARKLGLVVNANTDQRYDLGKETEAASQLLRSLYDKFGTWPLAITAYHLGSQALTAILEDHPNKTLFELVAKKHISDYAIEIYAAAHLINDPQLLKSR